MEISSRSKNTNIIEGADEIKSYTYGGIKYNPGQVVSLASGGNFSIPKNGRGKFNAKCDKDGVNPAFVYTEKIQYEALDTASGATQTKEMNITVRCLITTAVADAYTVNVASLTNGLFHFNPLTNDHQSDGVSVYWVIYEYPAEGTDAVEGTHFVISRHRESKLLETKNKSQLRILLDGTGTYAPKCTAAGTYTDIIYYTSWSRDTDNTSALQTVTFSVTCPGATTMGTIATPAPTASPTKAPTTVKPTAAPVPAPTPAPVPAPALLSSLPLVSSNDSSLIDVTGAFTASFSAKFTFPDRGQ